MQKDEMLSQILKPDFINNLLASMVTLNRQEDRGSLEHVIIRLSRLLHYNQKQREYTTVFDECTFIEHFLYLQQLRLGKRLNFKVIPGNSAAGYLVKSYSLFRVIESITERLARSCESSAFITVTFNEKEARGLSVSYESEELCFRAVCKTEACEKKVFILS